jgi:hypothetical protein
MFAHPWHAKITPTGFQQLLASSYLASPLPREAINSFDKFSGLYPCNLLAAYYKAPTAHFGVGLVLGLRFSSQLHQESEKIENQPKHAPPGSTKMSGFLCV